MLISPTLSATSRAGQPRPGAPAWAAGWAQLGKARVRTARVLTATARVCRAQGSSGRRHGSLLRALPGLEAQSSLTQDAGAGRTAVPSRCGDPCSFLPPPVPEAHAWVRPQLLLPSPGLAERPHPTAGAVGGWGEEEGIPLPEFGFSQPLRPRVLSVAAAGCCENHFRAAPPVPPAPAGGGGSGGAARTGTGKEVTFKPRARARGDREEGWGDGGEQCTPGQPARALAGRQQRVKRRSSNKNTD